MRRSDAGTIAATREPPVKVLYIAGVPHCGSSLLGSVLGQIESFFFVGELAHTAHSLELGRSCGCGAPLAECDVWRKIFEEAFCDQEGGLGPADLGLSFSDERARAVIRHVASERLRSSPSPTLDRARRAFVQTLRAIGPATGSRVVVDSSKSPAYGRLLDSSESVDLRVVHLVRDSRATAWSWQKSPAQPWGPLTTALIWDVWNPLIELLWARHGEQYLRLRYEDFVARPQESIARILDFVGEAGGQLSFLEEDRVLLAPTHAVAGNAKRDSGHVRIRLDDEWVRAPGFRRRRAVGALTWPLLRRYHYPAQTATKSS